MIKVVLITGSYPPDVCGVADYTARLGDFLREAGADVRVFQSRGWRVWNVLADLSELRAMKADVLHMQYPATGYGKRLGPQMLSLFMPLVLTLHECSQSHVLRRMALLPFSLRTRRIIFTNTYERDYARRFVPWIKRRSCVISIGSNVPVTSSAVVRLANTVTYFGLIRPQKGLEQVVEMARLMKEQNSRLSIRIVGSVMPEYADYYEKLRRQTQGLRIVWELGLDGEELSKAMAETEVAYLPFPDGASERRSSLIAMLSNGVAVITTQGKFTPADMKKAVLVADNPHEAVELAERMYRDSDWRAQIQMRSAEYSARFAWKYIAAAHLNIYQEAIKGQN